VCVFLSDADKMSIFLKRSKLLKNYLEVFYSNIDRTVENIYKKYDA